MTTHIVRKEKKLTLKIFKKNMREYGPLYLLFLPVFIFILIFSYIPLYGIIIAFQNYFPGSSFFGLGGEVDWVGLEHFIDFVSSPFFPRLLRNTLVLSGLQLSMGFWVPIVFALLLNEIRSLKFKKFVQTASYLPHFISTVVVAGIVLLLVSEDGLVNQILVMINIDPIQYSTSPELFPWIYTLTNIWKTFGWSSIIYMSTISSVDPTLYEAAKIDGANRFQQAMHITIPSIQGTIMILFIFAIGGILNANTEFIILMYGPSLYATADVFGTYVYRLGIEDGSFSAATAIGLFMQIIGFIMLYVCNTVARKVNGYSLW